MLLQTIFSFSNVTWIFSFTLIHVVKSICICLVSCLYLILNANFRDIKNFSLIPVLLLVEKYIDIKTYPKLYFLFLYKHEKIDHNLWRIHNFTTPICRILHNHSLPTLTSFLAPFLCSNYVDDSRCFLHRLLHEPSASHSSYYENQTFHPFCWNSFTKSW